MFYPNVDIYVNNTFRLGDRSKISRNVSMRAESVLIGKELWCNEYVEVGGGGWEKATAILEIGDHVLLGKGCSINVCAPVTIGSCTGIGIESMIFTHSSGNGQSVLDGYKHIEQPVIIGNHVSLFSRVIVAPGAEIADGVTVGAMAYLKGKTEQNKFYAGMPAKEKGTIASSTDWQSILQVSLVRELREKTGNVVMAGFIITDVVSCDDIAKHESNGCQVIICQKCVSVPNNTTIAVFDLGRNVVYGTASSFSENVRDALRRLGILFDYCNYAPPHLDYNTLYKRGVEKY